MNTLGTQHFCPLLRGLSSFGRQSRVLLVLSLFKGLSSFRVPFIRGFTALVISVPCSVVKQLCLSDCDISAAGIQYIADMMSNISVISNIRKLNLSDNENVSRSQQSYSGLPLIQPPFKVS